jgi:hypothetical protein
MKAARTLWKLLDELAGMIHFLRIQRHTAQGFYIGLRVDTG